MSSSKIVALMAGLAVSAAVSASAQTMAEIRQMDRNGDGVITRSEWRGGEGAFRKRDTNRDGVLSGNEVWDARDQARNWNQRFREFDDNRDGVITRNEWREASNVPFNELDRNRDNRISRAEFRQFSGNVNRAIGTSGQYRYGEPGWFENQRYPNAYMAGYERGWFEGKAAGREDRERNQGWDLDGQRELESADSGYNARFGSRAQYQEGYRDGFRAAYAEGWDLR